MPLATYFPSRIDHYATLRVLSTRYIVAMARVHGFRVYVVQAFPNRVAGKVALDVSIGSDVQSEIVELLERLNKKGTFFFDPAPPRNGEPPRTPASMTVNKSALIASGLLHATVSSGRTGSHGTATRPDKRARKLSKWSPEAEHIVTFLFPRGADDRFLVVMQTIQRADPIHRLMSLLQRESFARREENKVDEVGRRKARKAAGKVIPPKQVHRKLVFREQQAADNQYLDELLTRAKKASATFVSRVPSNRSSNTTVIKRRLTIVLQDEEVQDIGREVGRRWALGRRNGKQTTQKEGVSEVADLLVDRDLLDEDEAERYETVSINVVDGANDSTTIAVDTMKDAFTYPVSDGRPDAFWHYDRVAPRVKVIAQEERLEIEDVDAREVADWLTDSTAGP